MKGKNVIVTGSTSGIGWGIAHAFATRGARLVINGFGDASLIAHLQEELQKAGSPQVFYSSADLSHREGCVTLVQEALQHLGSVHVLVSNAGIQHVSPVEDFPQEAWEKILAINLSAVFYTAQAVLPSMRRQGWGRIINIASAHGLVASCHKSGYVAAKHGVLGLTKTIGLETAGSGITCNALCPGWVLTPLVEKQIEKKAQEKNISLDEAKSLLLQEKQPSGQFVTIDQLGEASLFLASEGAAQITGTSLSIDGGWTAQ